ncbi:LpqN/LpqT family lipoprotein [Mycobacterium sp. CVI_P3]|uniref:LpqN/LpqT family lipoprotein n=1 Tax=Mycobacterium pinniadriaticum TaxID=2994102 RepID=A0ABT3SDR0_9MYCO|nr:LpqN/LpqT family lipoprotein [Mycobacterium pinniadriaticum]MCX2931125.1 LpqN/LpqT family lipoprotein [Mycobacterium pinniadriaticum]MCX2937651.1 LpqN/LpqT family lipoprotein [Mycobacterium pinniadriaticum]
MTVAACGTPPPDYSSVWTTPTTTTATPTTSETPQPIAEYLYGVGVTGEQIPLDKLTDITVTLPRPPGWSKYTNSNFSPGTTVIAKNNTYPTAMVIVFKLKGNFDVGEALKHASADAELSQNFTKLNASSDDFDGFPSSMIEGSYDLNGKRLHSYNRVVIPVTPAPNFQRYLVQLTVTTLADQAAAASDDVEAIIRGFSVKLK